MVLYPNAKINLGLWILERRKDGFHNLETVFVPIGLCDILEFVKSKGNITTISVSGVNIDAKQDDNLVFQAWQLMQSRYNVPAVDIYLHKLIPVSAGLGGGSSDAAFMLSGLNTYFECGATVQELEVMAGLLGSDCPFFIRNLSAVGTGRGEVLEAIDLSLERFRILLVNPGIFISTREAYSSVKPCKREQSLGKIILQPIEDWQAKVVNDFEESAFLKYPEIESIKNSLLEAGAVYSAMSGSGSTVFGIFELSANFEPLKAKFSKYFTWQGPVNTIV
jgi:4-diphosphocytidyl-2-C-methyl-D-erythritol kinase